MAEAGEKSRKSPYGALDVRIIGFHEAFVTGETTTGVLELDFGAPDAGTMWEIDRIVVQASAGSGTTAEVLVNNLMRDVTANGDQNVGEYHPPIRVRGGFPLAVRFANQGQPTFAARCLVEYTLVALRTVYREVDA